MNLFSICFASFFQSKSKLRKKKSFFDKHVQNNKQINPVCKIFFFIIQVLQKLQYWKKFLLKFLSFIDRSKKTLYWIFFSLVREKDTHQIILVQENSFWTLYLIPFYKMRCQNVGIYTIWEVLRQERVEEFLMLNSEVDLT